VLHNYINRYDKFEVEGNYERLADKHVEAAVEKYFGRKLKKHESTDGYRYKNGYYYMPCADGEGYTFSQVTKLVDLGNDLFLAHVNVYVTGSGFTGDPHGTPAEWRKWAEATGDDYLIPELSAQMVATIKKISSGGKERFILIEYLEKADSSSN